jgi:diguanylate cyclase (GGDEF)-like protein
VLIVEPSAAERWRLRNNLIASRMEVFEAGDLAMALRACSLFGPDLILAQWRTPTHSGLDLMKQLKETASTRSIPVILYCDIATAEERVRAFDLGAVDVLSRPFVGAELVARVRSALHTRHLMKVLERRAHLDGLTGLSNRQVFEEWLAREWDACKRRGLPLAVAIADLDHFKRINDTHGHAAGDEVLRQAARTLAASVRESDLVARYGGEEFVVVAPNCGKEDAAGVAERFRAGVSQLQIDVHGASLSVTASIGVAAATDLAATSPVELLRQADQALYQAKAAGRNGVWLWEGDRARPWGPCLTPVSRPSGEAMAGPVAD